MQIHEACLVPYRQVDGRVEFCLVSPIAENRWEFPKAVLAADAVPGPDALAQMAAGAGVAGSVLGDGPLGRFDASRGDEAHHVTSFLMRVSQVDEDWPQRRQLRRLWCLPEEARARIRRKPLRRFIDVALHQITSYRAGQINGHLSGHGNGNGNGNLAHRTADAQGS